MRTRTVTSVLGALLLVGFFVGSLVVPAPSRVVASPSVLIVGDSLTEGAYASDTSLAFPQLVAHALAASELSVSGTSGKTVTWALDHVELTVADVVVVEFGTNDSTRDKSTLEIFRVDYPKFLDAIRVLSPDARLACLGTWASDGRAEFDAVIASVCAQHGGSYVDLTDVYRDRERMRAQQGDSWSGGVVGDDFHPGDTGHARIAELVLAALR